MDLNLNSISVDDSGRVSFSGLKSGIDFQGVVSSIIAAKRIPIDSLEAEITANKTKITALTQLKTHLTTLKDTLSTLRGAITFGNTGDVFKAKTAFASTSRYDGTTGSQAGSLIGITVSNSAETGSHTIQVLQTAKSHKISSNAIASQSTALGFTNGNSFGIDYTDADGAAQTQTFTVSSSTTLVDMKNQINNVSSTTGVNASIVKVTDSEFYLVLTKSSTGESISLSDTGGTPLADIGILDGGGAINNEIQAAAKAKLYADGVLDQTNTTYESAFQTSSTVTAGTSGQIEFRDAANTLIGTVNYADTDDLDALAANITANVAGVTATVVNDGAGKRLEIAGAAEFTMAETGAGNVLGDLGIKNHRRVIERDTNTINDLFDGVTLSVFQAEIGTEIKVDIEADLSTIKQNISDFVDAYNELRVFINEQRTKVDASEEKEDGDLTGTLLTSQALRDVDQRLSLILSTAIPGLSGNLKTVTQSTTGTTQSTGINFIARANITDPLQTGTLVIDEAELDQGLLNNVDGFRRLFGFDFQSSDPRVTVLDYSADTTYKSGGFTLNLQPNTNSNGVSYSEQFDNAAWTKTRATINADATTGPFGAASADAIVADSNNNSHLVNSQNFTVTAGETYVYSIYAKLGDKAGIGIDLTGANFGNTRVDVDLTNGSLVSQGVGADSASVEDVGNGWYRISVAATATGSGNAQVQIRSQQANASSFAGDGVTESTYIWGAQVENAAKDVAPFTLEPQLANGATTIATVGGGAPDGSDAYTIVADASSAPHRAQNTENIAVVAGNSYTFTSYVKAGDLDKVRLQPAGSGFGGLATNVEFNLATGSIIATGADATDASIDDVGGGWYRLSVTATAVSTEPNATFEITPLNAGGTTGYAGDGSTVNLTVGKPTVVQDSTVVPTGYVPTTVSGGPIEESANIDGTPDGLDDNSASLVGGVVTVLEGDAKGLKLFTENFDTPISVTFSYTVGAGAQLFFEIESLLDSTTGAVESEIDNLTDRNEVSQTRVSDMEFRLDVQRQSLLDRFLRMETALSTAQRIMDSIQQTTDALYNSNN